MRMEFPGLIINEDGTTKRFALPGLPADAVASVDVTIDSSKGIWVRVYKSQQQLAKEKKPLVVYTHGGGFVVLGANTQVFDRFCKDIAKDVGAVVVSVDYRLAPEHRLPTAYEDAFEAVKWLQAVAKDEVQPSAPAKSWLEEVDWSKVFVMGDSAGGNTAHHVAVRCSTGADISPLQVVGQILIQPFYGAEDRNESESKFATGYGFTLAHSDTCWKYSLPVGSDRDHPFCNVPLALDKTLKECGLKFPRSLIVVGGQDLLRDRGVEYAKILEAAGKDVKLIEYQDCTHGFLTAPEGAAPQQEDFFGKARAFMFKNWA